MYPLSVHMFYFIPFLKSVWSELPLFRINIFFLSISLPKLNWNIFDKSHHNDSAFTFTFTDQCPIHNTSTSSCPILSNIYPIVLYQSPLLFHLHTLLNPTNHYLILIRELFRCFTQHRFTTLILEVRSNRHYNVHWSISDYQWSISDYQRYFSIVASKWTGSKSRQWILLITRS